MLQSGSVKQTTIQEINLVGIIGGIEIGNYTSKPGFAKLTLKHSIIIHVEQKDQESQLTRQVRI